jgi:hypothetical protein
MPEPRAQPILRVSCSNTVSPKSTRRYHSFSTDPSNKKPWTNAQRHANRTSKRAKVKRPYQWSQANNTVKYSPQNPLTNNSKSHPTLSTVEFFRELKQWRLLDRVVGDVICRIVSNYWYSWCSWFDLDLNSREWGKTLVDDWGVTL